jgi:hypothetical protein
MQERSRVPSDIAALFFIAFGVFLASFLVLAFINEDNDYDGDRAPTQEQAACLNAEFERAITTGEDYDPDACKPEMPWYAAHPLAYATGIGVIVLVVGRLYLFMRRLEHR